MARKSHTRDYDLVVFGATGFTGQLVAEYVALHLPSDLRWALAGRSESKLQAVADSCRKLSPDRSQPAIEPCPLEHDDVEALAKKTFILIATIGPYAQFGEFAYRACAKNGTHYIDVTGEVPFTAAMIRGYGESARQSGAILISQCGVESAPSDLCTWSLAKGLRSIGAKTGDVSLVVRLNASASGGTLATALGIFDVFSLQDLRNAQAAFALSPVPNTYRSPALQPTARTSLFGLRTVPPFGTVTTSIANRTDGPIVERTWGLLNSVPSRKDEAYGPRFSFVQYMKTKTWFQGILLHWALVASALFLYLLPPLRTLLKSVAMKPGDGPSPEKTVDDVLELRGIAFPDPDDNTDKAALVQAVFKGGMYPLTAIFVCEAAMVLLEKDVKLEGGAYTPACLGQDFVDRVAKAGFKIETYVVDKSAVLQSSW